MSAKENIPCSLVRYGGGNIRISLEKVSDHVVWQFGDTEQTGFAKEEGFCRDIVETAGSN